MKKYSDPLAKFVDKIDIYESTDPVDADSVDNVPLIQLYGNTMALKRRIGSWNEASSADIAAIAAGTYVPDDEDDTGQIDDDGTIIEEATDEDIEDIINSYWND